MESWTLDIYGFTVYIYVVNKEEGGMNDGSTQAFKLGSAVG